MADSQTAYLMENEEQPSGQVLDAVIGLGANLASPELALQTARSALGQLGDLSACSSIYRTLPVGGPLQPDYLNAAVRLRFQGSPQALLASLLEIERAAGRERRERWGPRNLDLDILWIKDRRVDAPGLQVPHARLRERAFALLPLLEVAPEATDPSDGTEYKEALRELDLAGVLEVRHSWVGADLRDVPPGMDRPRP